MCLYVTAGGHVGAAVRRLRGRCGTGNRRRCGLVLVMQAVADWRCGARQCHKRLFVVVVSVVAVAVSVAVLCGTGRVGGAALETIAGGHVGAVVDGGRSSSSSTGLRVTAR